MFRRSLRPMVLAVAIGSAIAVLWPGGARAQQASLPGAREIVDRFIQVTGGAAAFKALTSMRAKGTFTITGQQLSGELEMLAARPNRLLTRVTLQGFGQLEEGYDGKVGWSIDPVRGPALVTGRGLQERADEAWFDAPLHGDDHVKDMTVVGREDLAGRPVYRIKVVSIRGTEQQELFDVENGFQVAIEASRETPLGVVPATTYLRDYRRFGLLMLPSTIVQSVLGQEQIFSLSTYEFDTVPAGTFELPPAIKALIK